MVASSPAAVGRVWGEDLPQHSSRSMVAGSRRADEDVAAFHRDPDGWRIEHWLATCASRSKETARAYRKEAMRFRGFLMALNGSPSNDLLAHASSADAGRYVAWMEGAGHDALPEWVGEALGLNEEQRQRPGSWRRPESQPADPLHPGKGGPPQSRYKVPSPKVQRQAVTILYGMYGELGAERAPGSAEPMCPYNPFQAWRKRVGTNSRAGTGIQKALSELAWRTVIELADEIPDEPKARLKALRRRLIFNMLRGSWDRRAAIASATWDDISADGYGIHYLRVLRKGDAKGDDDAVRGKPLPASLAHELLAFRAAVGLPDMIAEEHRHRSIFWLGGKSAGHDGPVSDDLIYREIKELFQAAAKHLEQPLSGEPETPAQTTERNVARQHLLRAGAGPHAIRHTMATQFMDGGGDPRVAQEILGHSSLAITTKVYDSKPVKRQARELQEQWERSARVGAQPDEEQS